MTRSIEPRRKRGAALRLSLAALTALTALLAGCTRAGGPDAVAGAAIVVSRTVPALEPKSAPDPPVSELRSAPGLHFTRAGTAVDVEIVPLGVAGVRPKSALCSGDDVTFRIRISDAATGRPIVGAKPAAWLAARAPGEPRDAGSLTRKVARLARGDPLDPPELDLNQFYVVALNDDATITIVDPRFGFGGSRLLGLVPLPGAGADWALTDDSNRLFVSAPAAGRIVVIDTASWTIAGSQDVPHPTRLVLQEDGHFVWVASDPPGKPGGVVALEAATLKVAARIETGTGPHDLTLGRDDLRLYVTNRQSGTLTVIDARRLAVAGELHIGSDPVGVAFSTASNAAYVLDAQEGTVAVVAGDPPAVVSRLAVGPGASSIGFAPGGRVGLVTRPHANEVIAIDAALDRIARRVPAEGSPDQVAFTDRVAYVRQADSPMLRLLPIEGLSAPNQPPSAIDVPIGRSAPGRPPAVCAARAIARASAEDAVLIANHVDQAIYYYKEGLSAPQGSFRGYGHAPVAVLSVDRSLRPAEPGVYQTTARLRRPGRFDLAVFVDSPQIVHCFEIEVGADPASPPAPPVIDAQLADSDARPVAGRPYRLRLKLEQQGLGEPAGGKLDVQVLVTLPGRWQHFFAATLEPETGRYAFDFTPPRAGWYVLYVECRSAGLALVSPRPVHVQVKEPLP
jgi:YVTN family beta-propeller protein